MTRRGFLANAALAARKKYPPPNVLLIITDQHYIQAMGAAGNAYVRTPHIDRLAREGTRFTNSWCTSPVCSPARASIVTGCLPHTAGVDYLGQKLDPKVPTVGELFRAAGYETVWAGKWHLREAFPGARFPNVPAVPAEDRGFDFLPFKVNEKRQEAFGDFTDERIAQAAADFVSRSRTKPFFLGLSLHNPHDICYWIPDALPQGHPGPRIADIPDRHLPPLPANFAIAADEPEFISRCRRLNYFGGPERSMTAAWDEKRWRQYLYAYYRMVERTDYNIGIVMEELRRKHQDENTMVVLTSDHGEGMAAHHWVMKLMLYQEPVSVPLIFKWKGWVQANRVEKNALASGIDIVPTLCDLARVAPPKFMHGSSLRGVLDGTGRKFRDSMFAELAPAMKDRSLQGRAVRTARWKYVSFSWGKNPEQFFDLEADPGEIRNLAGAPEHKEELAVHKALLAKWVESDRLSGAT